MKDMPFSRLLYNAPSRCTCDSAPSSMITLSNEIRIPSVHAAVIVH
jgi:hypothetical protein